MERKVAISIVFAVLLIATFAATNIFSGPSHKYRDSARMGAQLRLIGSALLRYEKEKGKLPENLSALADALYLNSRALSDPWGVPVYYHKLDPPEKFVVLSLGSDGMLGGVGNEMDRQVTALSR